MKKIHISLFPLSFAVLVGCSGGAAGTGGGNGGSGSTSSASATQACTTVADWSQTDSTECGACADLECSAEKRAFEDVVSSCERQYGAAVKCSTCGCIDNAITNRDLCRGPWDKYMACVASKCASPCK